MRVYYYIYKFEKEKCEFEFSYLKNDEQDICGKAVVELNYCPITANFYLQQGDFLSEQEKRGIISEVLMNLKL